MEWGRAYNTRMTRRLPRPVPPDSSARLAIRCTLGATHAFAAAALVGALVGCTPAPSGSSKAPVASIPLRPGVVYEFQPLVGPVASGGRFKVRVTAAHFPGRVDIGWTGGLLPSQSSAHGTRRLTALSRGLRLEPVFVDGEADDVVATAPWVSRSTYLALAAATPVRGFLDGALSLSGQAQNPGKGRELVPDAGRTFFFVKLDSKLVRIRAVGADRSTLVVADDPRNPLVLEYRTMGIGWRLVSVTTR